MTKQALYTILIGSLIGILIILVLDSVFKHEIENRIKTESIQKPKTEAELFSEKYENIRLYEIDSCEYIGRYSGNDAFLTHKGNCKFCEKRNEQNKNGQ